MWGGLAAASLLVGFFLAGRGLSNRTLGMIMGFGAGALLSAIAYELVPESELGGVGHGIWLFALGHSPSSAADWLIDHRAEQIVRILPETRRRLRLGHFHRHAAR